MEIRGFAKQLGRGLALTAAIVTTAVLIAPSPAQARVSDGAAIGIGLGSFALGTAVGASARPYGGYYGGYSGYPYGYYAPPPPAYYAPPAPVYYAPRSCWDPYGARYYAC